MISRRLSESRQDLGCVDKNHGTLDLEHVIRWFFENVKILKIFFKS